MRLFAVWREPMAALSALLALVVAGSALSAQTSSLGDPAHTNAPPPAAAVAAADYARARLDLDLTAVGSYRPEYPFWQHIFTIPDGRIAFGSAQDGRLLAVFPTAGDWERDGVWEEQGLNEFLKGRTLPKQL